MLPVGRKARLNMRPSQFAIVDVIDGKKKTTFLKNL